MDEGQPTKHICLQKPMDSRKRTEIRRPDRGEPQKAEHKKLASEGRMPSTPGAG